MRAGCGVSFDFKLADHQYVLLIVLGAALPEISPDGLEAVMSIRAGGKTRELIRVHLSGFDRREPWMELSLPLADLYTFRRRNSPGACAGLYRKAINSLRPAFVAIAAALRHSLAYWCAKGHGDVELIRS